MNNKIRKHPSLNHSQEINDICRPLTSLGITYFSQVRVNKEGKFTAIANNAGFIEHYLKNKYYNADIHMAEKNQFGKYVLWDAIERTGKSEKMYLDGIQFGLQHTFSIIERDDNGSNFYHFAANTPSNTINQTYLNNIDLLKAFIMHFNDSIQQSRQLSSFYDLIFSIDKDAEGYSVKSIENPDHVFDKNEFIRKLKLSHQLKNYLLTTRDVESLNLYDYKSELAVISHELKNPLSRMQFSLDLMSNELDKNSMLSRIDSMKSDIHEIDSMFSDILTNTQLSHIKIEKKPLKINELVKSILKKFDDSLFKNDLNERIVINANEKYLTYALNNILQNAKRFAKSSVVISLKNNQLLIEDDGPGIPAKDRDHIFNPYVQLQSHHSKTYGLGLAIVKKIIEQHDWSICIIDSDLGGAKFIITFTS